VRSTARPSQSHADFVLRVLGRSKSKGSPSEDREDEQVPVGSGHAARETACHIEGAGLGVQVLWAGVCRMRADSRAAFAGDGERAIEDRPLGAARLGDEQSDKIGARFAVRIAQTGAVGHHDARVAIPDVRA